MAACCLREMIQDFNLTTTGWLYAPLIVDCWLIMLATFGGSIGLLQATALT